MFIPTSLLIKFAPYLIVGVAVFGVYIYMQNLISKVEVLQADNVTLNVAVEIQSDTIDAAKTTIDEWAQDRKDLLNEMDKLAKVATAARSESRKITARLRDLGQSSNDFVQSTLTANSLTRHLHRLLKCTSRGENCNGELQAARVAAELTSATTN